MFDNRLQGRLKFFNPDKKFGFIAGDDGEDYYFHESALGGRELDHMSGRVEFTAHEAEKGWRAVEVRSL